VVAPDWDAKPECGHGLHGFLDGEGNGSLAYWDYDAVWIVAEIEEYVDIGGKVKFPRCNVVFSGSRIDATDYIGKLCPGRAVIGCTATAGYGGTATAGDGGTATAGIGGTATAGEYGTATAGEYGTATAGDRGEIRIRYHDGARYRLCVGYVGEDGIEPNIAYVVVDGKLTPKVD
jgi:hypothetical protein